MTAKDRDFPGEDRDLDPTLRDCFAALRREEEARAPGFVLPPRTNLGPARWQSARRLIAVGACMVIMIAAAFLFRIRPQHPDGSPNRTADRTSGGPVASITDWKPPTDFLLGTPGQELLQTVPSFGGLRDYANPPRQKQKHLQPKRQVLP